MRFSLDEGLGFLGTRSSTRTISAGTQIRSYARVLRAYASACTICNLKHPQLLDAAHIIADTEPRGVPNVTNGLATCKIHHAAYDRYLLGITPDYEARIASDLLEEVDGPMLRHGLQDMHGRLIRLPINRNAGPARNSLAEKFARFLGR